MSLFRKKQHNIPGLNTSSLPDLIFTVLFFFMIVTQMRQVTHRVKYSVPQGKELSQVAKRPSVVSIYIGKPLQTNAKGHEGAMQIQVDNMIVKEEELVDYLSTLREQQPQKQLTASIKADRSTPMSLITAVKQALRQSGILRVSYSAIENKMPENDR